MEPGEVCQWEGHRLVRVEPEDEYKLADSFAPAAEQEWRDEVRRFLTEDLGVTERQLAEYEEARGQWDEFNQRVRRISARVEARFGPRIDVILDGEIAAEKKAKTARYQDRLRAVFGGKGALLYQDFRERYASDFFARYRIYPDFIR